MNWSAVILAGGRSTRMGRAKHLISLHGQAAWLRQFNLLKMLGAREVALSLADRQISPSPEIPVIRDEVSDCGPMMGVVAALEWASSPMVLILAVDLFEMSHDDLLEIIRASTRSVGCVPIVGGGVEPLVAMYPKAAAALAREELFAGRRSARRFAERCKTAGLVRWHYVERAESFVNFNTPAQLCLDAAA